MVQYSAGVLAATQSALRIRKATAINDPNHKEAMVQYSAGVPAATQRASRIRRKGTVIKDPNNKEAVVQYSTGVPTAIQRALRVRKNTYKAATLRNTMDQASSKKAATQKEARLKAVNKKNFTQRASRVKAASKTAYTHIVTKVQASEKQSASMAQADEIEAYSIKTSAKEEALNAAIIEAVGILQFDVDVNSTICVNSPRMQPRVRLHRIHKSSQPVSVFCCMFCISTLDIKKLYFLVLSIFAY